MNMTHSFHPDSIEVKTDITSHGRTDIHWLSFTTQRDGITVGLSRETLYEVCRNLDDYFKAMESGDIAGAFTTEELIAMEGK